MCSHHDMIAVECLDVYAFHSYHIATWTHIHNNILTDQYNGFVTLKDFELPDDGFDWGAATCWSDWSVMNYPELICAFCWFIFCLHLRGCFHSMRHFLHIKDVWVFISLEIISSAHKTQVKFRSHFLGNTVCSPTLFQLNSHLTAAIKLYDLM